MRISLRSVNGNLRKLKDTGYSYALFNIIEHLKQLGHTVPWDDFNADCLINFSQPIYSRRYGNQPTVSYFPWESTKIPNEWDEQLRAVNAIWTTSEWVAGVVRDNGYDVQHVYPHGLTKLWEPRRRPQGDTLKVLHMGSPATRKGTQMAVDAFRKAFGTRSTDVSLTLKSHGPCDARLYRGTSILGPVTNDKRITVIDRVLTEPEIAELYSQHHLMIYPSWGEGWGLIPFQAAGSGMPTICTSAWCDYRDYIVPLDSTPVQSPWRVHEGRMYEPNYEQLVYLMRTARDSYDDHELQALHNAERLHARYNWLDLTEKAVEKLQEIV